MVQLLLSYYPTLIHPQWRKEDDLKNPGIMIGEFIFKTSLAGSQIPNSSIICARV